MSKTLEEAMGKTKDVFADIRDAITHEVKDSVETMAVMFHTETPIPDDVCEFVTLCVCKIGGSLEELDSEQDSLIIQKVISLLGDDNRDADCRHLSCILTALCDYYEPCTTDTRTFVNWLTPYGGNVYCLWCYGWYYDVDEILKEHCIVKVTDVETISVM